MVSFITKHIFYVFCIEKQKTVLKTSFKQVLRFMKKKPFLK